MSHSYLHQPHQRDAAAGMEVNVTITLNKFSFWQKEAAKVRECNEWLKHKGASGRDGEILKLSIAHGTAPTFSIAGQYTTGGKNYWESPQAFNEALKAIIHERFDELAACAVGKLEKAAASALVEASNEVDAVQAAINSAKLEAA